MSDLSTTDTKLPVTIITGFLGSGKTTLLNYILRYSTFVKGGEKRLVLRTLPGKISKNGDYSPSFKK